MTDPAAGARTRTVSWQDPAPGVAAMPYWFENGTDLHQWTKADLARVQASLNARPRPTLGLKTPAQALNQHLQLAARTDQVALTD